LKDGAHISYLNEDLDQPCWDMSHLTAVTMIGLPTMIIWVVGMPLFIFIVLEAHRKEKHNDKIRFRYGMLMEGYEDEYFYWESVIASRKMMVIGVSVFMSSFTVDIQAYVGIAIVILFMTMHISSNPYNTATLDKMEKYALATAFATLYVGLLFYITAEATVEQSLLVLLGSLFIVGINLLYMIYATWQILLYIAKDEGQRSKLKKVLIFFEPCINAIFCRSKKQIRKQKRLLGYLKMKKKVETCKLKEAKERLKRAREVANQTLLTNHDKTKVMPINELKTWGV
jgi:hypothetical protein